MPEHRDLGKEKPAAAAFISSHKVRAWSARPGQQHRKELPRRLMMFLGGRRLDEMVRAQILAHAPQGPSSLALDSRFPPSLSELRRTEP